MLLLDPFHITQNIIGDKVRFRFTSYSKFSDSLIYVVARCLIFHNKYMSIFYSNRKHFQQIIMQTPIILVILFFNVMSFHEQNFTYTLSDQLRIQPDNSIEVTSTLTMGVDQYINSGTINISLSICQEQQFHDNSSEKYPYNVLYFNLNDYEGRVCYYNYSNHFTIPEIKGNCDQIEPVVPCMNYSSCIDENVTYQYKLETIKYLETFVIIENKNMVDIFINTQSRIYVLASNSWFYWTVGLACLLVISLVVLTGVVFYWALKYKKTKNKFEQFKLIQGANVNESKAQ